MNQLRSRGLDSGSKLVRRTDTPWSSVSTRPAPKTYDNRNAVPSRDELMAHWKVAEAQRWVPVLKAMSKIEKIAALEPNWDGEGALAANPAAMAKALRLITAVSAMSRTQRAPIVDAVITPEGGFLVEWDSSHRVVQIQIHPDGTMDAIFADDPDSYESQWNEISNVAFRVAVSLAQSTC